MKHIIACAIVSLLAAGLEAVFGADFHTAWLAGLIAGIAIGVGKEYGDKCASDNYWDWSDITADTVGSLIGSTFGASITLI